MTEQTSNKDKVRDKEYVVGGYTFATKEEAQIAKDEMNAIKYLSSKTDGNDPRQVFVLYNKIIDRQLFNTSIGIGYLKDLQQFLYVSDAIPNEKIRPIPIKNETQAEINRKIEKKAYKSELRELSIMVAKYKRNFVKSMILNFFLAFAVIGMFIILRTSSNANIVNYEVNIQDKYSSWQQQLESEEESLKAREKEFESRSREAEKETEKETEKAERERD
ncbi:MAG: hypothetical protein ACI4E1_14945 [Lachnospira sp.]